MELGTYSLNITTVLVEPELDPDTTGKVHLASVGSGRNVGLDDVAVLSELVQSLLNRQLVPIYLVHVHGRYCIGQITGIQRR